MPKEIALFPKQLEFIKSQEREVLFDGGIGTGKTYVGAIWLAKMALTHKNSRWLMVARDANQLRNATKVEFEYVLNSLLGLKENVDYKKTQSPQLEYQFNNGAVVVGAGAHNYDSVFRGPSVSGILGDEVDYWKPEAFLAAKGRVRKYPELIRWVSSPKGFNHVYEDFYVRSDPSKKIIRATTYDNPTLSQEYVESLRKTYSPRMFEQEVLAKRLRLNAGCVYSEFKREVHVKPVRDILNPSDQLYFFTDYNISNYCGCYMFMRDGTVYVIGEEHLKFQGTREMAQKIKAKYPTRPIIVVGDSTGNNKKDVAINRTNYQIFQDHGLLTKHVHNPPVQSRIISAESNLYHNRVFIDDSCKTLIRDLELLAWKEDGKDIDKSDITLSHASDAFSYGLYYFLPTIKPQKSKIQFF